MRGETAFPPSVKRRFLVRRNAVVCMCKTAFLPPPLYEVRAVRHNESETPVLPGSLEWPRIANLRYTVCKAPPILFVPARSFRSFADSFLLVAVLPVRFDIQKIFSVKGAPAFGFDIIVDNERIFRFG